MRFVILLVWLLVMATNVAAQKDPLYNFPLKINYRISGAYAELRGNHYHAGLDMSTMGVENVEVHAAEKGWVSRVKVSPYGYGRALYIDHPDGHTTVYGHLNGFASKIDEFVRKVQYATESFDVDTLLSAGQIVVERDEVVALSGNTGGSGGPHLHFEVRDTQSEEPLNPLRFLPPIKDDVAPVLYGIKVYALGEKSQVDDCTTDKYFATNVARDRRINVFGEIGLGLHCTDYIGQNSRPCGVVCIELYDNEKLVFKSSVEHFSFETNRHVNSHIDYAERRRTKRFVQKSFVEPGNKLPIYSNVCTPIRISDGEVHKMLYVAKDFAGNRATLSFTLVGKKNLAIKDKSSLDGEFVDWQRTWVKDTLGIEILMPHHSLFDNTCIAVEKIGEAIAVGNPDVPFAKAMSLTMNVPNKWLRRASQVYIGCLNEKGVGAYLTSSVEADTATCKGAMLVKGLATTFGRFAVCIDSIAPTIRIRNKATTLKPNNLIMIGVADDVSGISHYDVRIDGRWEVFEYDYKKARLIATPAYLGLNSGRHHLVATVTDACGNSRILEWDFTLAK